MLQRKTATCHSIVTASGCGSQVGAYIPCAMRKASELASLRMVCASAVAMAAGAPREVGKMKRGAVLARQAPLECVWEAPLLYGVYCKRCAWTL